MGEARIKEASAKEVAFSKTNMCVFCGGTTQATTVDHCPPRAIFSRRQWPEGYVFPACMACNAGSKLAENWVALLSRLHPDADMDDEYSRPELEKLARPLLTPHVLRSMELSVVRKRQLARRAGIRPAAGETFADLPMIAIPEPATLAIPVFARKIAKALHFMHTGCIVPSSAAIEHRWYTNFNGVEQSIPEDIFTVPSGIANLRRASVDLSNQFNYKYAAASSGDLSIFTIWFRFSFCINILLAFDPQVMERAKTEASEKAAVAMSHSSMKGA